MSVASTIQREEAVNRTLVLLDKVFSGEVTQKVGVRLWEGTLWPDGSHRSSWMVLNHPGALRAMFLPPTELGLAEAYLYDDFDIEGNVEAALELAEGLSEKATSWLWRLQIGRELLRLPTGRNRQPGLRGRAGLKGGRHSIRRDRQAIGYHYDVSNDFYALWLDKRMVYSCAYFESAGDDLNTAQEKKLDIICTKVRLSPGQRLLDIGCGWGGLVIHAAAHYGVTATGITLSQPQADYANALIIEKGLADRCRVEVQDYREVSSQEKYDVLVSVGMFEHVGEALLPAYFSQAWQLLKPGGVFLNHGIARNTVERRIHGRSFSNTYVFPDGELVPINVTLRAAEEDGFEVRDVESHREHYAMTLRHWVSRLASQHEVALHFVDEPTYRVWRLFMSASALGFATGKLNLYQALLLRPDARGQSGLPLTRDDWYTGRER